jgi:hypothetical protein
VLTATLGVPRGDVGGGTAAQPTISELRAALAG